MSQNPDFARKVDAELKAKSKTKCDRADKVTKAILIGKSILHRKQSKEDKIRQQALEKSCSYNLSDVLAEFYGTN